MFILAPSTTNGLTVVEPAARVIAETRALAGFYLGDALRDQEPRAVATLHKGDFSP